MRLPPVRVGSANCVVHLVGYALLGVTMSQLRYCPRPTWWNAGLGFTNTDIARPEQVQCEVAGNRFDSYAAVTKDGKDVICARVTKVLEEGIGFGQAFVDWAVTQTVTSLQEHLKPWTEHSPRQLNEIIETAKQARFKTAQEAAEYGTRVHELIEMWTTHGDLIYEEDGCWYQINLTLEAEPVRNATNAFIKWWQDEGLTPVISEQWLVDIELGFGGTLDHVARAKDGALVMCDWKTSKAIRDKYLLQVAAYDILWDSAKFYSDNPIFQEKIQRAYIVRVDKATAEVEIFPVFRDEMERQAIRNQWYATLQTFRWLKDTYKMISNKGKKISGKS